MARKPIAAVPPVLLAHIVWMPAYQGELDGLHPGTFKHGTGDDPHNWHERYNFRAINGKCHGCAFHYDSGNSQYQDLNIDRLGAPQDASRIDGVTVVYTARHPKSRKRVVVGWYRNARVFREPQIVKFPDSRRNYYFLADKKDCELVPVRDRVKEIPTAQKSGAGFPGMAAVFYASDNNPNLAKEILRWIASYRPGVPRRPSTTLAQKKKIASRNRGKGWGTIDSETKAEIEKRAMNETRDYFEELGWRVEFVHKDNEGWDLVARRGSLTRLIEVKGLSGEQLCVELTPNEYKMLTKFKTPTRDGRQYLIAVVTKTLTHPTLHVFECDGGGVWRCHDPQVKLDCKKIVAARFTGS